MLFMLEQCMHNAKTGQYNYKQTKTFNDFDNADKEFCNFFATYINYGDLDKASAIIWDEDGNPLQHKTWHKAEEPAPEPNEE